MTADEMASAAEVEAHESIMWARCVEAAAAIPGNPLGAEVDWSGPVPLTALTALDSDEFNRVVAFGVQSPASEESVDDLVEFYARRQQKHFRVELPPVARPEDLPRWFEQRGLTRTPVTVTKMWGPLTDTAPVVDEQDDMDVRVLDASHRTDVARINAAAYGDWSDELHPWWGCTLGHPGFIHYGVFIDGRMVSTAGIFIEGGVAWMGFAATHPRARGRHIQQSITPYSVGDARTAGCHLIHAEVRTDRASSSEEEGIFSSSYEKPSYRAEDDP